MPWMWKKFGKEVPCLPKNEAYRLADFAWSRHRCWIEACFLPVLCNILYCSTISGKSVSPFSTDCITNSSVGCICVENVGLGIRPLQKGLIWTCVHSKTFDFRHGIIPCNMALITQIDTVSQRLKGCLKSMVVLEVDEQPPLSRQAFLE